MGDETLFVKPVLQELGSFFGGEHKVIRQKRSSKKTSRSTHHTPKHCQMIQGEQPFRMAFSSFYQGTANYKPRFLFNGNSVSQSVHIYWHTVLRCLQFMQMRYDVGKQPNDGWLQCRTLTNRVA